MKVRMRFVKRGPIKYIGHLDLMRFFQKVFRRCGLDVSYSQGFNPHQILSFASPLGVGLTSIGEYLDAGIESLKIITDENKRELTPAEWIDRINAFSNDMVIVTSFNIMPDDTKPSMALLAAASYAISFNNVDAAKDIAEYYNNNPQIIYEKTTKKSVKEINLKEGIYMLATDAAEYYEKVSAISKTDSEYESEYIKMMDCTNPLYMICSSGSSLNIKPEMLIEAYEKETGSIIGDYDIIRLDMYAANENVKQSANDDNACVIIYESMSCGKAE